MKNAICARLPIRARLRARARLPIRARLPAATVALTLPLACAPPADEPDQGVEVSHTEVAHGIYQLNAGSHNAFFVDTDGGVVAFDPISIEAAAGLAVAIRSAAPGKPLAAIVYSHSDADHATGAPVLQQAFEGDAPIIAQERAFPSSRLVATRISRRPISPSPTT
ncbi:MAG: MBL fold metallo-hydrolase [Gemmatimonadetes bacterium]|nr:MBL fold metallo-hydrolase [Gemmatimonadota bacterium]MYG36104.1 MBL fold metallo-hydrolase [Gemmatimonadota bacterium]